MLVSNILPILYFDLEKLQNIYHDKNSAQHWTQQWQKGIK